MKKAIRFSAAMIAFAMAAMQITSFSAFAEEVSAEEQTIYTGECGEDGDNITWTYDVTTKTMTFSGTGAMKTYAKDHGRIAYPEWVCGSLGNIYEATEVIFEEGITDVKAIDYYFFKGTPTVKGSEFAITIPESVTSMDFSYMPTGIKLCGKYGSWFYYHADPNYFYGTGVAEKEYISTSGESETGFKWDFDYVTRILTIDGTDAIGEDGRYARSEISPIFDKYAKAIVIGKDFIVPTDEKKDENYWCGNGDIPVGDYIFAWVCSLGQDAEKESEVGKIYCYKDSNFANVYEPLKEYYDAELLNTLELPHIYNGRVVYIDDPDETLVGDVNLDGKVDLTDAIWLSKHTASIVQLTDAQKAIADCDGDGSVTDADVTTLMEYLMFQIPSLPYQA